MEWMDKMCEWITFSFDYPDNLSVIVIVYHYHQSNLIYTSFYSPFLEGQDSVKMELKISLGSH